MFKFFIYQLIESFFFFFGTIVILLLITINNKFDGSEKLLKPHFHIKLPS